MWTLQDGGVSFNLPPASNKNQAQASPRRIVFAYQIASKFVVLYLDLVH